MSLITITQTPKNAPIHTFFVIQVYDGRGFYGFGVGLTDQVLANDMLHAFGSDLLGRKIELISLAAMPPEAGNDIERHRAQTQVMQALWSRSAGELSPSRAFLVAFVHQYKNSMPLSVLSSILEHAKYEPDHEQYAYVPIHESAIGRAYP
ncbi:hypothetical protein QN386_25000 [Pseudomonas sp. CCI3.2]|uniref:hypothetical protein n=1 Tax=unclassified Pseudomonas TaxID=196821 RepID=UPI002AC95C07|nr:MULTISPECIES: hypothetical protein [unclassified Pseudomonas]MEA9979731.1 hypothetical protein [Pseudomonas sp. RTS4]MEB0076835.1 hypothetical protein [Pseudomonas sp. MH10out]MEB0104566.1 hypothetical protein [Pseudomonas sp. CCI3.2]MEB0156667.1 hypothetical protein [Pseudomonas sp. AH2 (2023)]MEB0165785.1 hypothetical protein [Pseudomonas sp. CCC4.4]